ILGSFKVDNCDQPFPPIVKVLDTGYDLAKITWYSSRSVHPNLVPTHFSVDYCRIHCDKMFHPLINEGQSLLTKTAQQNAGLLSMLTSVFSKTQERFLDYVSTVVAGSEELDWKSGLSGSRHSSNSRSSLSHLRKATKADVDANQDNALYLDGLVPGALYLVRIQEKTHLVGGNGVFLSLCSHLLSVYFHELIYIYQKGKVKVQDNGMTVINSSHDDRMVQFVDAISVNKRRKFAIKNHKSPKKSHPLKGLMAEWKLKFQFNDPNAANTTTPHFAVGWCSKKAVKSIRPSLNTMHSGLTVNLPKNSECGIIFNKGSVWKGSVVVESNYSNPKGLWKVNDTILLRLDTIRGILEGHFPQGWFRASKTKHISISADDIVLFVWISENTKVSILEQKYEIKDEIIIEPLLPNINLL
ncbi:hypothetical protein RFI_02479, partial [Reticulomyxa filosa]